VAFAFVVALRAVVGVVTTALPLCIQNLAWTLAAAVYPSDLSHFVVCQVYCLALRDFLLAPHCLTKLPIHGVEASQTYSRLSLIHVRKNLAPQKQNVSHLLSHCLIYI
jgi:hypothetical protein